MATIATLAAVCLSCGSSSSSNTLSSAQAQAVSQELFTALGSALNAGLTPPGSAVAAGHPSLAEIMQRTRLQSTDCTTTATGESCNIPLSFTGNCPNGGTISVAGDFMFTLDNSGNGTDSSTLTITPTSCAVSDTTFSGDPNVTVSTQFSMQNDALAYPITFSENGGISFGPNPSGSCSIKMNLDITSATTCTASGTICGQSVSGSC